MTSHEASPSLRLFDRFASSAPPPQDDLASQSKATAHNVSAIPERIEEDTVEEEVKSVKAATLRPRGHKREESEQTLAGAALLNQVAHIPRRDKASQVLGIPHRSSMEPVPVRKRTSIMSTRSAGNVPQSPSFAPSVPLASLYVVSGLPKRPQTWTLADPDAVQGLNHSEGAVGRWWRAEVLGSTVSPGVGGGKKKKVMKGHSTLTEVAKGPGALTKQETAKMLSKALKLSFTREVEIIASTLQPASTVHTFTFTLPAPSTPLAPPSTLGLSTLRNSVLSASTEGNRFSNAITSYGTFPYSYADTNARPSSAYLGPSSVSALDANINTATTPDLGGAGTEGRGAGSVTYHGVCLTVWSHADSERSAAIRRTLESVRSRKESAQSVVTSRLKALRSDVPMSDPTNLARRSVRNARRGPWSVPDGETDGESEIGDAVSESEFDAASTTHGPGESTLFLTGDTVFWLPYALTLVSRHPIYDLMRDYLTLSWARFSKDVASHTLQISKILSHPAPRAGDIVRLDASPKEGGDKGDGSLEVVARFPGGLDFGRGLVDINFTMWPLFKCLNIDNILSICEIALAPTGRILFFSRHPATLGIAVATIKYLVELRGWNGIALPAVHARDARIYIEDPGPWIIGMGAEMRYAVRPPPEVCICDLDINYLSCAAPPPGCLSVRQQRDKYRAKLLSAFGEFYHPDHSVPIEFKEAFPAGRFRPICKIQAKRGASSSVVAESVKAPEWWHSTKIIQAFDAVLQDKFKKPSLFKRISSLGSYKRPPRLSGAEQQVQNSIRKRATAFVDARDDLETKIGRLSRRLNFLVTESDLWREKFVTFESYAEKLSSEASDLRAKINKEQRESKRLTGLVSFTAAEKLKLQSQLLDTESAHKNAMLELESMRQAMEKMEDERAQLVEEVEAQIERALASMSMSIEMSESEDGSQLDGSQLDDSQLDGQQSESSRPPSDVGSRRSSNAVGSPPRTFSTDSTLAGTAENDDMTRHSLESSAIAEEEEEEASPTVLNIDASGAPVGERSQDAMVAVDEGIHQNSDKIAQKVMQIQQKLESALSDRRVAHWRPSIDSETEGSDRGKGSRPISPATARHSHGYNAANRTRSNTVSSSQTTTRATKSRAFSPRDKSMTPKATPGSPVKAERVSSESVVRQAKPASPTLSPTSPSSSSCVPSTPSVTVAATEDSDTDFQSAYSASPRESYHDDSEPRAPDADSEGKDTIFDRDRVPQDSGFSESPLKPNYTRERISSDATAITRISGDRASNRTSSMTAYTSSR
ncbi:AEX-3 domain-containing protein [Phellopilus nigrolimitatus]|nr:AEX-3 domain-containing protein [Phellopilus nigrolimitatus]